MKNIIVANAGPIIALGSINRLDLLKNLFHKIVLPDQVRNEILEGGSAGSGVEAYNDAHWIQVKKTTKSHEPLLTGMLHGGEAQVIQLALELSIDRILIDESKARKIARNIYGLKVIGTTRVLIDAKKKGLIGDVSNALQSMRENGYWISDRIVTFACQEAGEINEE